MTISTASSIPTGTSWPSESVTLFIPGVALELSDINEKLSVDGLTGSSNVNTSVSSSRLRTNERSSGGVLSEIWLLAFTPLPSSMPLVGFG